MQHRSPTNRVRSAASSALDPRRGAVRHASRVLALASAVALPIACGEGDSSEITRDPAAGAGDAVAASEVESGIEAAESWLLTGRPELAEPIARRLVLLRPESAVAHELLARSLALGAASIADDGRARARRLEALEHYESAVRLEAEAATRAGLLHAAGVVAEATGDTSRAIEFYERAERDAPGDFRHPLFLGNALLRLDRLDDAAGPLQRARALDSTQPWTHAAIAERSRRLGRHDDALESIEVAVDLAPASSGFRIARARILRAAGRPRDAARSLTALGESALLESGVLVEFTAALEDLGEHAVAARAWERRLAAHADDRFAAIEAARAWERAGDPIRARAWRDRAALIDDADDAPVRGGPASGG